MIFSRRFPVEVCEFYRHHTQLIHRKILPNNYMYHYIEHERHTYSYIAIILINMMG